MSRYQHTQAKWDYLHYTSPEAYSKAIGDALPHSRYTSDNPQVKRAMHMLVHGNPDTTRLVAKIHDAVTDRIVTPKRELSLSPAGFMPCVPAYLAGHPEAMYTQSRTSDQYAPIRIILNVSTSSGLAESVIAARGAAMLALLDKLSNVRAVTAQFLKVGKLEAVDKWLAILVDIPMPLVLGPTGALLAHANVTRHASWCIASAHWSTSRSVGDYMPDFDEPSHAEYREILSLSESDIVIRGAYLTSPMYDVPSAIAWVEARLAELT